MPQHTLNIFDRALLLSQRRNGSANDLKGELRQVEIASEFMEHPLAKVVGVEEASNFVGEDEVIRETEWVTSSCPSPQLLEPALRIQDAMLPNRRKALRGYE